MADYKVTDTELTGIADAIRAKDGIAEEMEFPSEFESRIAAIPQGSSVQSDWEQTDETADDYIKNKPSNLVSDASYVHTDNNYTSAEKNKLQGISTGAEVNVQSDWSETDNTSDAYIVNKPQNLVLDSEYVHTDNNYTSTEKTKLGNSTATPTENRLAMFDSSAHMNSTDMTSSEINSFIDAIGESVGLMDIGQANADLIADDLANTLTLNSSYFSGTAKYDKIGDMVIVYVNVTTTASQSNNRRIESGAIPSGSRPSTNTSEVVRSYPSTSLRVTTGGYVYLDYNGTTIPSGTVIKGEVCYFV